MTLRKLLELADCDVGSCLADLLVWVDHHRAKATCLLLWGYRSPVLEQAIFTRFAELTPLPHVCDEFAVGGIASVLRRQLELREPVSVLHKDLVAFVRPYVDRTARGQR